MATKKAEPEPLCDNCKKNQATRIVHTADGTPHARCDSCPDPKEQ